MLNAYRLDCQSINNSIVRGLEALTTVNKYRIVDFKADENRLPAAEYKRIFSGRELSWQSVYYYFNNKQIELKVKENKRNKKGGCSCRYFDE